MNEFFGDESIKGSEAWTEWLIDAVGLDGEVADESCLHDIWRASAVTLLKSLALSKGQTTVTREEFDEFLELSRFFNSGFNPV